MPKDNEVRERIAEASVAREAAEFLGKLLQHDLSPRWKVEIGGEVVSLPRRSVVNLHRDLEQLSLGKAPSRAPADAELGTQEAADILNVSRPYFVKLLEQGAIPYRRVGNRRRVRIGDLMDFKAADDDARRRRLADLEAEDGER